MNCSEIESRLCAYRDELLPPEEKDRIEKHISTCVQCGKALADLKRTADLLRDLEAVEPPPFFAEKIMARVREDAGRKRGIRRWLFHPLHIKAPIQAIAMILIAVSAIYVYQKGEPEMRKTTPLPAPIAAPEKGAVTAEPAKAPSHTGDAAPSGRDSALRSLEPVRERPSAPPVAKRGKEEATAEFAAPPRKDREPVRSSAALDGETETGAVGQETPRSTRDREDRAGPVGEAATAASERKMMRRTGGIATGESAKAAVPAVPPRSVVGTPLDLRMRVEDVTAAVRKIEAILDRFGARVVESRRLGQSGFMKVEIAARHAPAFRERLEGIGRVDPRNNLPAGPDGKVTVRIHIVGNP